MTNHFFLCSSSVKQLVIQWNLWKTVEFRGSCLSLTRLAYLNHMGGNPYLWRPEIFSVPTCKEHTQTHRTVHIDIAQDF